MADAIAKAFLYDAPQEPRLRVQRALVVYMCMYELRELRTGHARVREQRAQRGGLCLTMTIQSHPGTGHLPKEAA